jgi:cell fate regulator YaaT (PSP1 superfamily)
MEAIQISKQHQHQKKFLSTKPNCRRIAMEKFQPIKTGMRKEQSLSLTIRVAVEDAGPSAQLLLLKV